MKEYVRKTRNAIDRENVCSVVMKIQVDDVWDGLRKTNRKFSWIVWKRMRKKGIVVIMIILSMFVEDIDSVLKDNVEEVVIIVM